MAESSRPRADETAECLLMAQMQRALILGAHGDQDRGSVIAKSRERGSIGSHGVGQTLVQLWGLSHSLPLQLARGTLLWVCFPPIKGSIMGGRIMMRGNMCKTLSAEPGYTGNSGSFLQTHCRK